MNGIWTPADSQYKARTIIGYLNRLFLGNVYEIVSGRYIVAGGGSSGITTTWLTTLSDWYLNRIRWSNEASVTEWNGRTAGFYDLPNQGDGIRRFGVFQTKEMVVFRDRSVYSVVPAKDPDQLIVDRGSMTVKGIWAPNSLQQLRATPKASDPRFRLADEESFVYLGFDDVYRLDTTTVESIGAPIRTEFFRAVEPTKLLQAWSFQDTTDKKYYLVTTLKDSSQHAWIYDWEEKTWSRQDFADYTSIGEGQPTTLGGRRSMSLLDTVTPTTVMKATTNLTHVDFTEVVTPIEGITEVKA